jgi:ABC-type Fe3+ transport system substrate-binding protein
MVVAAAFGAHGTSATSKVSAANPSSLSGNLDWWTDWPQANAAAFIKEFNKQYPNIKVSTETSDDAAFVNRFAVETKNNKVTQDVITIGYDGFAKQWDSQGLLMHYCSPQGKVFPAKYVGKNCAYYVNAQLLTGMCYNSQVLKQHNVPPPTSYEDLVNGKYKGLITMQNVAETNGGGWALLINLKGFWTKDGKNAAGATKWTNFFQSLGQQSVTQAPNYPQGQQTLAQGNAGVFIPCYPDFLAPLIKQGAPVKWIGAAPIIQVFFSQSIPKAAPDPAAAKAFMDFALSKVGQDDLVKIVGQVPTRPGVAYPASSREAQGLPGYPALDTPWSQQQDKCCAQQYTNQAKKWFGIP